MKGRRGFNLIELVLALGVMLVAFVFVFTTFSGSARHAIQSRNRKLAILTAQSLLEEVRAHEFGRAAPKLWPLGDEPQVVTYRFVVSGKEQLASFRLHMKLENSALIGKSAEEYDRVEVVVDWDEQLSGDAQHMKQQQEQRTVKASLLVAPDGFSTGSQP